MNPNLWIFFALLYGMFGVLQAVLFVRSNRHDRRQARILSEVHDMLTDLVMRDPNARQRIIDTMVAARKRSGM